MSTVPCRYCACPTPRPVTAAPSVRENGCARLCPCHMDERQARPLVAWEEAEADRIFEEVWKRTHP